ncbi:hypothetical protein H0H92_005777 [Tricholoma furcatifolium]|nr:hypothetical protein H0H92_005777 [Tricholoma furcatifolium]
MDTESSPLGPDQRSRFSVHFSSASAEDLLLSSPPYRSTASVSNLHEEHHLLPSPAYSPPLDKSMTPEKRTTPDSTSDVDKPRPTVRYADNDGKITTPAPVYSRSSTIELITSRASTMTTDDEESEDYDWSGEEDLVDEEAKFEERMGSAKMKAKRGWSIKRIVTTLFSTLIGSTFLAGILVIPGVIVHLYWYNPHPTEDRLYVKDNVQAWLFWAASNLVLSWYLAMMVDVIPVVVQYFIAAAWGHVSEYVKNRIEVYDSLKNDVKPLFYAASAWVSWIIIFTDIYELYNIGDPSQSRAGYTERLQQVVEFFFFFALMYSVKQLLSHTIAFLFHRTAYKDRIDSVKEALKVVETLRQHRPKPQKKTPGSRTPIFGSISAPLSDHQFQSRSQTRSPPVTPPPLAHSKLRNSFFDLDDGADADHEDAERTLVDSSSKKGKNKKDRSSWNHPTSKDFATSLNAELSDIRTSAVELEAVPLNSRPTSPVSAHHTESSSSHRYPPMSSSSDGHGRGTEPIRLAHAAQVLKNAVLHDARNIKGQNIGDGSMAWNISSTNEAKRLARAIYIRFKDRGRNYLLPSDFYPAFVDQESAKAAFRVFDKDDNGDISRAEIKNTLVRVYKERRFLSRSMRDVGAALKTLDQIIFLFAMVILFFVSLSVFGVNITSSLSSVYSLAIAASFIFKNAASNAFDAIMFMFVTHLTMQVAWRTPLEKLDQLEKLMNEWLSTEENRWYQPSTSVDWDLRNKRKTAFHAAAQYYCRQLGITYYESPIPVVYADPHKGLSTPQPPSAPTSPTVAEDFSSPDNVEDVEEPVKPLLGFLPPASTRSSHLRARRSKNKKAAMRSTDAE